MTRELEIYFDGACRGNPGPAAIGVVIYDEGQKIKEVAKEIGEGTNNIAEYSALLHALNEAKQLNGKRIKFYTDSELLAKQVTGKYKVKNEKIKLLFEQVAKLSRDFEHIEIKHVPREKNKEADFLATEILKKKQAKVVAPLFHHSGEESPSSTG